MSTFTFGTFKYILMLILLYFCVLFWCRTFTLKQSISTLWYFYFYTSTRSEYFSHLWVWVTCLLMYLCLSGSFHGPGPQRFPPYAWKERPLPPAPRPVHHPYAPNMTNSRKYVILPFNHDWTCFLLLFLKPSFCVFSRRQNSEYSPNVVKRQRIESHPHPSLASPLPRTPPPRRPDRAVAGSSRPPFVGHTHSFPSPPALIHPQGIDVPENSLQAYARDEVLYIQMALTCSLHHIWCVYTAMLSS